RRGTFLCGAIDGASRDCCCREIDLVHEAAKARIVHYALKKMLVLARSGRFAAKQKVMQPNGGAAEGVRLNDVRAGCQIIRMNPFDNVWTRQVQQFETSLQVLSIPILELISAVILLGKSSLLDHGPHRAIEHDDAFPEEDLQRM